MIKDKKEKILPIAIGVVFVFLLSSVLYWTPMGFNKWLTRLQNLSYDLMLRFEYKPVREDTPVVIVDIDDQSISEEGRWPWNRKKMGQLVSSLYKLGANTVAFDIVFPEPEENLVDQVVGEIKEIEGGDGKQDFQLLESARDRFDYDAIFANALREGNSVLGFAFTREGKPIGSLPFPLFSLTPEMMEQVHIPEMDSYLANLPVFEKSATTGGFINATPGEDGVLRYSPMILRYQNKVYPSLSLAATKLFLKNPEFSLIIGKYKGRDVVEGIRLGKTKIPTDPYGRILIPFRGPPYSLPYISASDILNGRVDRDKIANKLIFIGSTATALGDLVAAAIAPVFAGIEVHAHIASGILDGYLPYKPTWEKGVRIALVFGIGMVLAFVLPFLGPILASILTLIVLASLIFLNHYIWDAYSIVFPIVFPLFSIAILYIVNVVFGYLFEARRRKELKSVFGQYVPPECIDSMLKKSEDFMKGEAKELTVLFADIRAFTTLSETLSPGDLKQILNDFLTPMTEVIFNQKGTIDKYVGDMIMAFWGAPLEDPTHAEHAIEAALDMQWKLGELNEVFRQNNKPELSIGIGINSGTMNIGDMGSKYRRAYTVLGDAVNLGSRLESLTKLYKVKTLVGEKTYEMTQQTFSFRLIDRVKVVGKGNPTSIYEPLMHKDEESAEIRAKLDKHAQGLEAYKNRNWDEAEKIFGELKGQEPLYELYLSRIQNLREHPPEEGWDGVTILDAK